MVKTLIKIKGLEYSNHDLTFTMKIKNFDLSSGKTLLITGESGSGKSTFLNLLSGTIIPKKGDLIILEKNLSQSSSVQKDKIRGDNFGIIFQTFNLIPYLSVENNIKLGLFFSKKRKSRLKQSIDETIEVLMNDLSLNYEQIRNKKANNLSIGQQQRVAVARALIGNPEIILADEPTSALDEKNQKEFMNLLFQSIDKDRQALIMVSHNKNLANNFSEIKNINDICKVYRNE